MWSKSILWPWPCDLARSMVFHKHVLFLRNKFHITIISVLLPILNGTLKLISVHSLMNLCVFSYPCTKWPPVVCWRNLLTKAKYTRFSAWRIKLFFLKICCMYQVAFSLDKTHSWGGWSVVLIYLHSHGLVIVLVRLQRLILAIMLKTVCIHLCFYNIPRASCQEYCFKTVCLYI